MVSVIAWPRWHVALILLGLMGYVLIGYRAVPFHGDEADHLHKSHDFVVAVVLGRPANLRVSQPVQINSTEHIRLLTGSTHAYLTGYALWSMGVYDEQWPRAWNYAQDVAWNQANDRWPADRVLQRGRLPHVLLTVFSVPLAFGIVWMWRPPYPYLAASVAAILVATHPAWLLNGRRVLQEAALVTLSLAVVWLAMQIATHPRPYLFGLLSIISALCIASKPTGLITVGAIFAALVWVLWERTNRKVGLLWWALAGIAAIILYVLITPPIWGNPPQRIILAAQLRADVLAGQTAASPDAYSTPSDRLNGLIRQPFVGKLQYYESPVFEGVLDGQINAYERGGYAGWQWPPLMGWVMTACGLLGLVQLVRGWRDMARRVAMVWLLITPLALLISVPLEWQRYYLLWSVGMSLLTALGLVTILQWLNGYRYFWRLRH